MRFWTPDETSGMFLNSWWRNETQIGTLTWHLPADTQTLDQYFWIRDSVSIVHSLDTDNWLILSNTSIIIMAQKNVCILVKNATNYARSHKTHTHDTEREKFKLWKIKQGNKQKSQETNQMTMYTFFLLCYKHGLVRRFKEQHN